MTRFLFTLLFVALPSVALAQTAEIQKQVNADLDTIRKAERTEDVEIMRRILNKSLGLSGKVDASCTGCHTFPAGNLTQHPAQFQGFGQTGFQGIGPADFLATFQGAHVPAFAAPVFDAVYLPGHGAVFTLKVPASAGVVLDPVNKTAGLIETCLKCHTSIGKPDATPSQAKSPSEWDRARDEVRGVKPSTEVQPAAKAQPICEPGKLTELIAEKLWANAKNVRHLPAGEHLTIAITFDGHVGSAQFGSWSNRLGVGPGSSRSVWGHLDTGTVPAPSDVDYPTESTGKKIAGFTDAEVIDIMSARGHIAAGRHAEAVTSYLKALGRVHTTGPVPVQADKLTLWKQRFPKIIENITREVASVRRELSAASAAAGNPGDAKTFGAGAENVTLEPIPTVPNRDDPNRSAQPRVAERVGFTPEEVRLLTLGDLHLKQGKPTEAAQSYEQALARYKNRTTKIDPPSNLTPAQMQNLVADLQSGVRGAFKQLAQAWLAAGDTEKASAALDLARNFTAELPSRVEQALKGVPVPAKLVISITRSDAEKVATEEAFRKAVKVEITGFPPAEKPKQP